MDETLQHFETALAAGHPLRALCLTDRGRPTERLLNVITRHDLPALSSVGSPLPLPGTASATGSARLLRIEARDAAEAWRRSHSVA